MRTYALLLSLSFLCSAFLTPRIGALARRFNWLDRPGARKVHTAPTPRLGGVAIYISMAIAILPLFLIHSAVTSELKKQLPLLEALAAAATVIFLLGIADDIFNLSPYLKLLVEIGCSLWVFYHGIHIGVISSPLGSALTLGRWSLPLTLLWLVGITNAFNLVDGIDGLAGGIAVFGMMTLAIISVLNHSIAPLAVLAALAGATAGFLLFNFHPATIFLGDSGSLFLGFSLASLSLIWGEKSSMTAAILGPILIFGLPVADTGLAIARRFLSGVPIFTSDSEHIHHRLLRLGMTPRKVVLILYVACFAFSLVTLVLVQAQAGAAVFIVTAVLAMVWIGLSRLGYHELGEINLTFRRGLLEQKNIIRQRVQLRKAAEVIDKAGDLHELWNSIQEVARIFDFDYAELILTPTLRTALVNDNGSNRDTSLLTAYWKSGSAANTNVRREKFWRVEVPYKCASGDIGRVVLGRDLDKEELHLRMDPFVRLLSSSVSSCIARLQGKAI